VAKIPSGFVRHLEHPLDLIGRKALLGLDHGVGSEKPLPEGQMRIMEDGSSGDGELVAA
jgi:hypothetical protein